jgi:hypothetical protein
MKIGEFLAYINFKNNPLSSQKKLYLCKNIFFLLFVVLVPKNLK